MKTFSIISLILFAILLVIGLVYLGEVSDILDIIETFGGEDFSDTVYALGGTAMVSSALGVALSIVGIVKSVKKDK